MTTKLKKVKMVLDYLGAILDAKSQWVQTFKITRKNNFQSIIFHQPKPSIEHTKIKTFSHKQGVFSHGRTP